MAGCWAIGGAALCPSRPQREARLDLVGGCAVLGEVVDTTDAFDGGFRFLGCTMAQHWRAVTRALCQPSRPRCAALVARLAG